MLFRKIESLKTEEKRGALTLGLFSGVLWSQVWDMMHTEHMFTYHWSDGVVRLKRAHDSCVREATLTVTQLDH